MQFHAGKWHVFSKLISNYPNKTYYKNISGNNFANFYKSERRREQIEEKRKALETKKREGQLSPFGQNIGLNVTELEHQGQFQNVSAVYQYWVRQNVLHILLLIWFFTKLKSAKNMHKSASLNSYSCWNLCEYVGSANKILFNLKCAPRRLTGTVMWTLNIQEILTRLVAWLR